MGSRKNLGSLPTDKKRSKYHNRSSGCLLKHQHDSAWEADVCNYLYSLTRDKKIKSYITQKTISISVKDAHICNHIVDFYVITNDNREFFLEAKGFEDPVWRIKRKLTQAIYTKIPYITVYKGQLELIDKEIERKI